MSLKIVSLESFGMISYSQSVVTMAAFCIISEISEILVESRDFFIPLAFDAPVWEVFVGVLP